MAIRVWKNPDYFDRFGNPKSAIEELYSPDELLPKKKTKSLKATLLEFDEKNKEQR